MTRRHGGWAQGAIGALALALAAGLACTELDCEPGGGDVIARFSYVIDETGTEADLHGFAAREDLMLAVGDGGAVLVGSVEQGTWTPRSTGVDADLRAVAIPDAMVAVAVGADGTVIRSDDAGESWSEIDAEVGTVLSALAVTGDAALIAVGDGAWRSADAGQTWSSASGLDAVVLHDVAVIDDGRLLAVGDAGRLARSEDAGATWSTHTIESELAGLDLRAVSFRGGGEGRIATNSGRVLATEDGGQSWATDGVVAGGAADVVVVSSETWVAADTASLFYRHHTDPAYVERVVHTAAERYFTVGVTPWGDAVFLGEQGTVVRARVEVDQVPQQCL